MTTTPEAETVTDTQPHLTLAGLAQQAAYAYRFAKAGQTAEALEHLEAIERLSSAYRVSVAESTPDTLPQWLHWRFGKHGQRWDALDADDQAYWEHQAAAVRRAVGRGGFKPGGQGAALALGGGQ